MFADNVKPRFDVSIVPDVLLVVQDQADNFPDKRFLVAVDLTSVKNEVSV